MTRFGDPRGTRLALVLWIIWAVLAWNVVFDQVLVVAGRDYLYAAAIAAQAGGPYARINDWMRPAIVRGLWMASVVAGVILLTGFLGVRIATRAANRRR